MIKEDIEVEENVYVRLEPSESIDCKRILLEAEEKSVEMQIAAERFKELRRIELRLSTATKRGLQEIHSAVNRIVGMLPKEHTVRIRERIIIEPAKVEIIGKKEEKEEKSSANKTQELKKELEEIRDKIEQLR